jgi:uncharacterized protein
MKWMNEPEWNGEDGRSGVKAIRVQVPGGTDCWRKTRHNMISDNVPFYYRNVMGDFEVILHATTKFTGNYEQAGIMVRESPEVWMTCGFQVFDGQPQASAVITRDTSDWSLLPLPETQDSMYFVVKRTKEVVECFYSFDGFEWTQIRQSILSEANKLMVGLYGACPQGEGFEVVFEHFTIKSEDGELDLSDNEGEDLEIKNEDDEEEHLAIEDEDE